QQHQIELGARHLVRDQQVPLAGARGAAGDGTTIDHGHGGAGSGRPVGAGGSHHPRAHHDHVGHEVSVPIHSSMASGSRGSALESTSAPSAVTRRSSSMRKPLPRSSGGTRRSNSWKYNPGSTVSTWPSARTPSV